MKILYVTTIGGTMNFFNLFIRDLLDEGHIVDIATNGKLSPIPDCYREWGCGIYHIETSRSPLSIGNLIAIKQIQQLVEANHYDIVHCHTPLAAMCTRIACRNSRKQGTKVIYTAHGFHFYKGAPFKNWILYYPVEKVCAPYTDALITINSDDYSFAKAKLNARKILFVPGVGIDLKKFGQVTVNKATKRRELGIPENAVLLLSVGELNQNKNHKTVIQAIANMDVFYIIAGRGSLLDELQSEIDRIGMSDRVKLLGYRNDIQELCQIADIFLFPSFREGLPVSVMEAMANRLPCVASNIRGNTDLVISDKGGYLCAPGDISSFSSAINRLVANPQLRIDMGEFNREKVKEYDVSLVNKEIKRIYSEVRG